MKTSAKFFVSALLLAGAFVPECAAQDWPNLNCYREANASLMEARQSDPDDARIDWVVFMGDSGTQGWTEKDPEFFTSNHFYWIPELKPADTLIELNRQIKAYADANHIPYADYHSALVDDQKGLNEAYRIDTAHPSLEGYKLIEPLVLQAIKEALAQ